MTSRTYLALLVAAAVLLSAAVGPVGSTTVTDNGPTDVTAGPGSSQVLAMDFDLSSDDSVVYTGTSQDVAAGDPLTSFDTGDDVYLSDADTGDGDQFESGTDAIWLDRADDGRFNKNGQIVSGSDPGSALATVVDPVIDIELDSPGTDTSNTTVSFESSGRIDDPKANQQTIGLNSTPGPAPGDLVNIPSSNNFYIVQSTTADGRNSTMTLIGDDLNTTAGSTLAGSTVDNQTVSGKAQAGDTDADAVVTNTSFSFSTTGSNTLGIDNGGGAGVDLGTVQPGELLAIDTDADGRLSDKNGVVFIIADEAGKNQNTGRVNLLDVVGRDGSGGNIGDGDPVYYITSTADASETGDIDDYYLDTGSSVATSLGTAFDHLDIAAAADFNYAGNNKLRIQSGSTGSSSFVEVFKNRGSATDASGSLTLRSGGNGVSSKRDKALAGTTPNDDTAPSTVSELPDDVVTLKYDDGGDGVFALQEDIVSINDADDTTDEGTGLDPVTSFYGDALADMTVINTGTLPDREINGVALYRESGNQAGFQAESADTKVANATYSPQEFQWNMTGMAESFGSSGAQFYVVVNISDAAAPPYDVKMSVSGYSDSNGDQAFTLTDGDSGLFVESASDNSLGVTGNTIFSGVGATIAPAKNEPVLPVGQFSGPEDDVFPGDSYNATTITVVDNDADANSLNINSLRVNITTSGKSIIYLDGSQVVNVSLLNTTSGDLIDYTTTANTTTTSPTGENPHYNLTGFNIDVPDDSSYNFTVNVTLSETGLKNGRKMAPTAVGVTGVGNTTEKNDVDQQEIKTVKIHGWRVESGTVGHTNDISVVSSGTGTSRIIKIQNASGGLDLEKENFANDTVFNINATFYDFKPRGAISQGKELNWTRRYPSSNRVNVTFTVEPEDINFILSPTPSLDNWPTGSQDQADISYNSSVLISVTDLSFLSSTKQSTLNGTLISTDAQSFKPPSLSGGAYQTRIGAPGTTVNGNPNPGFFQVFLPDALINQWGVSPSNLQTKYKGSSRSYTFTQTAGGVRVEFDTDYSAGDVDISPSSGGDSEDPTAEAGSDRTVAEDTAVQFDGSLSDDDTSIESYEWDFGDGSTATGKVVEHTYADPGTYTVTLTVTDSAGKTDTDTATVTVTDETAPTADAGTDRTVGLNASTTFDAGGSSDNGNIESYAWDFGDGTTATGAEVTHAFDALGTYEVTLTVTDAAGNEATDTATVTVADRTAPTADAGADRSVVVGETVALDAGNSSDNVGIESYEWDFGDGTTATGAEVTHAFDALGTYEVTLTVTDAAGNEATDTATVTVAGPDIAVAEATLPTEDVRVGETVEVSVALANDGGADGTFRAELVADDRTVATREVTVPGGETVEVTLSHAFDSPGTYTLSVGDTEVGTVTVERATT
ncbi:MAG: PKD domain-containing protein, partial [Haloplanus sp.]